jgi:hypothetical protein
MAQTCNHNTGQAEVGESQVQCQPCLHNETMSQKKKKGCPEIILIL